MKFLGLILLSLLVSFAVAAGPSGALAGEETAMEEQTADSRITEAVKKKLADEKIASASSINVVTVNGKVTLTGTIASQKEADEIVRLVEIVADVKSVDSQLIVGETGTVAEPQEKTVAEPQEKQDTGAPVTTGTAKEREPITDPVETGDKKPEPITDPSETGDKVSEAEPSEETGTTAVPLETDSKKREPITDPVETGDKKPEPITDPAATGSEKAPEEMTDDAKISSAVRLKLAESDIGADSKIEVVTNEGIVTLNGTVSSRAEGDKAVELARLVENVKNVVSHLTVKSSSSESDQPEH